MASAVLSWFYSQLFVTPSLPTTSFEGKTVVVTGANRGLGLEATRQFVRLGASKVIMAVRNVSRGEAAKIDIENTEKTPTSTIEIWYLDMASYDSVKQFIVKLRTLSRLDALIASAGTLGSRFSLTDGHETTVTINVISTFLLAISVLPIMKETASKFNIRPHLVIVSSEVHNWTSLPAKDKPNIFVALNDKDSANMMTRYADTKLMEILVLRELFDSVIESPGTYPIIINTVNPGFCQTDFGDEASFFFKVLKLLIARRVDVGSRTYVHASGIGNEGQGKYLSDCAIGTESPFVRSEQGKGTGKRLWEELRSILEEVQPGVTNQI